MLFCHSRLSLLCSKMISKCQASIIQLKRGQTQLNYKTSDFIFWKYFQNCKQLEAEAGRRTTPLLKTADMNQNKSAKEDRQFWKYNNTLPTYVSKYFSSVSWSEHVEHSESISPDLDSISHSLN